MTNRTFLTALLALAIAGPAAADVTIKQISSGKMMVFGSGKQPGTTYIKGNKMRSDITMGDKTHTTIFDLDAQKLYVFDSKKKEADVWDMATFAGELSKSVDMSGTKASFKPSGQTKQIGGHTATGYDMEVSTQAAVGGNKEMTMTVTLIGPVWIVKDAPGSTDYARFYKTAVEKGWIFSDPNAAKGQPGHAKAMAEMYKQVADAGGIAYETDVKMKMGGGGMGGMLGRMMGGAEFTTVVESVDTASLADDLFTPPAGYKLKEKK